MDFHPAMRREEDIEKAVTKHNRKLEKIVRKNQPVYIYLKAIIYWPNKKHSEFDCFDKPQYVLQEIVQGTCLCTQEPHVCMKEKLREYGRRAAKSSRPAGVEEKASPLAITFSVEAVLASSIEPGKPRKVKGFPVLLVGGRTENGRQFIKAQPIALSANNFPVLGEKPVPEELLKEIERVKDSRVDFMEPFFNGFASGVPPSGSYSVIQ